MEKKKVNFDVGGAVKSNSKSEREREREICSRNPGGPQAAAKFQLQLSELKKTLEKMSHGGVPGLFCSGKARGGLEGGQPAAAQTPGYHAPATELIRTI